MAEDADALLREALGSVSIGAEPSGQSAASPAPSQPVRSESPTGCSPASSAAEPPPPPVVQQPSDEVDFKPPSYLTLGGAERVKREKSNVMKAVVGAFEEAGAQAAAKRKDSALIKEALAAGEQQRKAMASASHHVPVDAEAAEAQRNARLAAASRP